MDAFPEFMKHPANRIATGSQATPGVEGYVFDGADRSQMAFWTCHLTDRSAPHVHEFDAYMVVVRGCYTLIIDGERIPVRAGEEYFIPKGVFHGGEPLAGTRTIHAFGGGVPRGLPTSQRPRRFRGVRAVRASDVPPKAAIENGPRDQPEEGLNPTVRPALERCRLGRRHTGAGIAASRRAGTNRAVPRQGSPRARTAPAGPRAGRRRGRCPGARTSRPRCTAPPPSGRPPRCRRTVSCCDRRPPGEVSSPTSYCRLPDVLAPNSLGELNGVGRHKQGFRTVDPLKEIANCGGRRLEKDGPGTRPCS